MQIAAGQLIASVAALQGAAPKGVETRAATGAFPKMLLGMMTGSAFGGLTVNSANSFGKANGDEMPGQAAMSSGNQEAKPAMPAEALLQMIEELKQSDSENDPELKQLEQVMEQLGTLLIPIVATYRDEMPDTAQNYGEGNIQAEQSKPVLKELVQQLITAVTDLAAKHPEHPLLPVALQQLTALKQEILTHSDAALKPAKEWIETAERSGAKFQFGSPVPTVHSLLQKLNQSANHVHLMASVFSQSTADSEPSDIMLSQASFKQTAASTPSQPEVIGQTGAENRPHPEPSPGDSFVHSLTNVQEHSRVTAPAKLVVQQPVPVQEFAETMRNLFVKQLKLSTADGVSEAKLSLYPEQLGQVDVRISVHNGQVTALFMTDSGMAKELLDNQIAQLRAALQQQGLQVDKLEVAQSGIHSQLFQDGRHSGQGQRNYSEQSRSRSGGAMDGEFETEMIEQAVINELGYGRGINVTA